MADLDSASKRRSHVHMLKPYSADIPWPTLVLGDIDQGDRQHFAWLYSGILAAAVSSGDISAQCVYLGLPPAFFRAGRAV